MPKMQNEPDWGKRGVWAAYIIGAPTLLLGIFAYFRPPDPAHPIQFNFLFKSVSIPIWVIIALLGLAIGLALAYRFVASHFTKSPAPSLQLAEAKPTLGHPEPRPRDTLHGEAGAAVITTPEQLVMRIRADPRAITMIVDNNRLGAIHHLDIIVYSAYSFDDHHQEFRTHAAASGVRMQSADMVGPSESSKPFILVNHPPGADVLQLGNDNTKAMKWPENDKANIQKWKLNLSFGARAYTNTIPATGEVFTPLKYDLLVTWNRLSDELLVQKL